MEEWEDKSVERNRDAGGLACNFSEGNQRISQRLGLGHCSDILKDGHIFCLVGPENFPVIVKRPNHRKEVFASLGQLVLVSWPEKSTAIKRSVTKVKSSKRLPWLARGNCGLEGADAASQVVS